MVLSALVILLTAIGSHQTNWITDLVNAIVAIVPSWLNVALAVLYAIGFVYAVVILIAAIVERATMGDLLRDVLSAMGISIVLVFVLAWLVSGTWPLLIPELSTPEDPVFPVVRVAVVTSVLVVAGPHLVLPLRRLSWFMVGALFFIAVALAYGLPIDAAGGLFVGILSANTVLLIFGSSSGFPPRADVLSGMEELNEPLTSVELAPRQTWGARRFYGTTENGARLSVKVYGRDAASSQLFHRWWRELWYRDAGPSLSSSRLHQVEHEALLAITAGSEGVPVEKVVAVGEPDPKMAIIALTSDGKTLAEYDPEDISDETLGEAWHAASLMREHDIAHGRLNLHAFRIDDGVVAVQNFQAASTAAPEDRLNRDVAELLASLAAVFGEERSVSSARTGIGDDVLLEALPYVQRSALSSDGRDDVPSKRAFFSSLRDEVGRQTDTEVPAPAQVTRLNWKSLLMFGLTLLAGYALIGMLAGIDFAAVWEELQNADWAWILFGFVAATLTLGSDALVMMAAVSAPVPLRPAVQLQSSIKFVQLAVGGAAGRMATNITFLRHFGVSPTDSVTQGSVDSLTGFIVQVTILLMALLFGNLSLIPDDATVDINWVMLLGLILFAVVISALMVRFVPAMKEKVIPAVQEMWNGLRDIATDPRRLVRLFGWNVMSQLLFGASLWLTAFAFGVVIPLTTAVVIYVIMALLSGILPIPGGVGVSEAVLTAGLMAVGVDESTAFAIAVVFRVSSAYLPPVAGWFSLRWLQANDYL
ncbi:MAG: lysylphosphatidylglycerol synthase transmembrane domain-containing protein [Acidimicrobiia bacterium]